MTTRVFARSRFSTVVWMASRSSDERQMPRTRAAACLGALVPALRAVLPCRRPLGLRGHHAPILNLQVYMPMVNAVGYTDNGYCRTPLHVGHRSDSYYAPSLPAFQLDQIDRKHLGALRSIKYTAGAAEHSPRPVPKLQNASSRPDGPSSAEGFARSYGA